jgi:hypothetical protein
MHNAIFQKITIDNKYLEKTCSYPLSFYLPSAIRAYRMNSPRLKEYRTAIRSTPCLLTLDVNISVYKDVALYKQKQSWFIQTLQILRLLLYLLVTNDNIQLVYVINFLNTTTCLFPAGTFTYWHLHIGNYIYSCLKRHDVEICFNACIRLRIFITNGINIAL